MEGQTHLMHLCDMKIRGLSFITMTKQGVVQIKHSCNDAFRSPPFLTKLLPLIVSQRQAVLFVNGELRNSQFSDQVVQHLVRLAQGLH